MTLSIEKILKFYSSFFRGTLPDCFTFIANSEEEAKEMTEEIVIDGKNYKQDIESAELTEEEKNVFRRMTELKKKTDMTAIEQTELDKLMNEFIRIKIAHATASDEEVNDFIKKEKGSRGKIQLTKKEVENGVKEMARLKQSLNRFYFVTGLKKDKNNKNIAKILSINEGKIELREMEEEELKKIYDNNNVYYFNEKKLTDKQVKETYNIDDKLFFHIIDNINKNGRYSIYLRKNENGISMAYTILKYCFEKNIIKMSGEYTEGGFISYIYEKNINIDNDAFIKILCEVGDIRIVNFLINKYNIQNYEKEIFFSGCVKTIHLFEDKYGEKNITSKALEGACKAINDNNVGVIKYLLSNYDWKYIDLIKAYNSIKDPRMAEPIFEEIKLKIENKKEIKELIEEKDKYENTVLHYVAKNGNLEIFRLILENLSEQEKKELIKEKDKHRLTALHYAALSGNLEIVKLILENLSEQEKKELIKEKNRNGQTALHYAAEKGNLEIVKLILKNLDEQEKKELIKEEDRWGETVLHYATINEKPEIVKLLLENLSEQERKELIKEKDRCWRTVLHYADGIKDLETIKLLLDCFDHQEKLELIKEKDEDEETLLHYAAENGNLKIVELLLGYFDHQEKLELIKEKDKDGKTALDYAYEHDNSEIYNFLQNIEKNIVIEDNNKLTEEEYNNIIDANNNLEKNENLEMLDKTSKSIDEIDDEQQNSEVSAEKSNGCLLI